MMCAVVCCITYGLRTNELFVSCSMHDVLVAIDHVCVLICVVFPMMYYLFICYLLVCMLYSVVIDAVAMFTYCLCCMLD